MNTKWLATKNEDTYKKYRDNDREVQNKYNNKKKRMGENLLKFSEKEDTVTSSRIPRARNLINIEENSE